MVVQLAIRTAALLTWCVWLGGFAFYSGLVIPILHEAMTSFEAGRITQQTTHRINFAGAVALCLNLTLAVSERSLGGRRAQQIRRYSLATALLLLIGLVVLHYVMDRHLAQRGLDGFYPLHRIYLIVSTIQWFVGVIAMSSCLSIWTSASPRSHTH